MSVIHEILEFRKRELERGRTPSWIELSSEQKAALKKWFEANEETCRDQDGQAVVIHSYYDGTIFGMRYAP